jgi:hypothetical protein
MSQFNEEVGVFEEQFSKMLNEGTIHNEGIWDTIKAAGSGISNAVKQSDTGQKIASTAANVKQGFQDSKAASEKAAALKASTQKVNSARDAYTKAGSNFSEYLKSVQAFIVASAEDDKLTGKTTASERHEKIKAHIIDATGRFLDAALAKSAPAAAQAAPAAAPAAQAAQAAPAAPAAAPAGVGGAAQTVATESRKLRK